MTYSEGICLQCGESRESVRKNGYSCSIWSGYEYLELEQEWVRHHWRDWSDAEFRTRGIHHSLWGANRRTEEASLGFLFMESECIRNGHIEPNPEWSGPNCCPRCYVDLKKQGEFGQPVRMEKRS